MIADLTTAQSVRFRREIIDGESGLIVNATAWTRNLILDWGMEAMANVSLCNLFTTLVLGIGNKGTKRDSGTVTAAANGTTVTASAAFFEAADVGRVLKFDNDPTEYRIGAFGSATQVELTAAANVAAQEFTIWYANETTHETELLRTQSYAAGAGFCGSTFVDDTWTHRRTFLTGVFAETKLVKEIGWSNSADAGAPLYGRALIPGGGDLVTAGQRYRVQVEALNKYSPKVPQALGNVCPDAGFDTTGQWALESVGNVSKINADGSTLNASEDGEYNTIASLEPLARAGTIYVSASTLALRNLSSELLNYQDPIATADYAAGAVAYVAGSRKRYWTAGFDVNTCNSPAIRSVEFIARGYNKPRYTAMRALFAAPQTKDTSHNLSFTFGMGWGRVLAN